MIFQYIIQKWWGKTGLMTWEDYRSTMPELKHTDTSTASTQPLKLSSLPVHEDDTEAAAAGFTGGELYQTSTGELRIKVPEILP